MQIQSSHGTRRTRTWEPSGPRETPAEIHDRLAENDRVLSDLTGFMVHNDKQMAVGGCLEGLGTLSALAGPLTGGALAVLGRHSSLGVLVGMLSLAGGVAVGVTGAALSEKAENRQTSAESLWRRVEQDSSELRQHLGGTG